MNKLKTTELHIGLNIDNHDTGIFVISENEKNIFAISTDRITRYKHDNLLPFPAIEKYIQYSKLDTSSLKKLFVSIPYNKCKGKKVSKNLYQYNLHLRNFLNAAFINDFFDELSKFKESKSIGLVVKMLLSKNGIKLLMLRILLEINLVSLERIVLTHLKGIFQNAEIQIKYFDHEYCHATTAFYMSPYNNALVFAMDGMGDDNNHSRVYIGENDKLTEIGSSSADKAFLI